MQSQILHRIRIGLLATVLVLLAAGNAAAQDRIYHDPYANVDWSSTQRYLAQTHDHTGFNEIWAYKLAGYSVIPYGDYSSNPDKIESWTSLRWPPEDWLPPWLIAATANDLLYTGVEHTFGNHVISMFLYTYLEGWYPALGTPKQSFNYEGPQEKVDLINAFGGLAIDAHPVDVPLDGVVAQEVYNAHFRVGALTGRRPTDFNETYFLPIWDSALSSGRLIWGVGVNDHYGPTFLADSVEYDSGKTVILAPSLDEAEVRAAFTDGRLFAVRDLGITKGLYPQIDSISVSGGHIITIETTDSVRWISMGAQVGTGPSFNVGTLAGSKKYIRAEVENADGSIVYVQPFGLRPAALPPCGIGPELALLLPLLVALRRARQPGRG